MKLEPFGIPLNLTEIQALAGAQAGVNKLSQVRGYFADPLEVSRILQHADPIIYEFTALRKYDENAGLSLGITVIYPGKVGDEFYMTKGHFHARSHDGDEVYYIREGNGRLLLLSHAEQVKVLEMSAGSILYIPAGWGHRTVNVGQDKLVFLSVWPSSTEYDYQSIVDNGGFPRRIVERDNKILAVDNQNYRGSKIS